MPFVPATCPKCGGTLEVDPTAEAAVCKYCNTPFIVEKAITNYNTTNNATYVTNTTNNTTIENSEVHIHNDGEDAQSLLDNIKAQLSRGKWDAAYKTKDKLVEKYPADYRADEAELAYYLRYSIDEIIKKDSGDHYAINSDYLIKYLLLLNASNGDVCKRYLSQIETDVNEYYNNNFGVRLTGGLAFYKLYAAHVKHFCDEFVRYISDILPSAEKSAETARMTYNDPKKFKLDRVAVSVSGVGGLPFVCERLKIFCDFLESGKLGIAPGFSVAQCPLNGTDDEFCDYIASLAENCERKTLSDIEGINAVLKDGGRNDLLLDATLFAKIKNAAIKLMTPEGRAAKEENERRKAEAKIKADAEKARRETQEQILKITAIWEHYTDLLKRGKYKDALNFIEFSRDYPNAYKEVPKFKKTLFGYKYEGNALQKSIDDVLRECCLK